MDPNADRKRWMSLMAKAPAQILKQLWGDLSLAPEFDWLRPPEVGGTMVQGRMGGSGSAFNLGEMTVTRCSVRLHSGEVGHAYVQGRDKSKAQIAALVDALMQGDAAHTLRGGLLDPLRAQMEAARQMRAAKAAATKVEFFTMMRGED